MPNHCYNRVTFYSPTGEADSLVAIEKLKQIFEDEKVFGQIIPEPDWSNTPLMTGQEKSFGRIRGNLGELPVDGRFQSTDQADDRWYDWRIMNWDTKWDCYDVSVDDDDPEHLEISFNTAWSPPEAICNEIREQYPDVKVSWFYDEPGVEIAGYL